MSREHWVRVFKIPYRKEGDRLIREADVKCETVKSGLQQPGEVTCIPTDIRVTAHVVIPYFDEPKTAAEQGRVDALYQQCEEAADRYVQNLYPNMTIVAK